MKVLKVIPFTYLPMLQEQELHYFTDEENIKKFNAVILKVRGIDTPGIVSEVMDLNSAKIYLKKFYDYELKPIEKILFCLLPIKKAGEFPAYQFSFRSFTI